LLKKAMTLIRDIMNSPVVSIRPETTLEQAIFCLTEHHIGGAPVVANDGAIVGMVSELALIDVVFDAFARFAPVSRYMNQEVHVVYPDDSISRAAQLFALYSFRRLPVAEHGKLVGIVTRRDLMNHALRSCEVLTEPLVELIPALAPMS
jgi:tRNA nucleotidyltransferase (CCA-adding enzyme)